MPTANPVTAATVADLVAYWTEVRENGPLAATTVSAYLGAIARVLHGPKVTAATPLDELDLRALTAAFAAAHPDLRASTVTSIAAQLRAAVNGYRIRHQPDPARPFTPPAPEAEAGASEYEHEPEQHPAGATRADEAGLRADENRHTSEEDEFDGTLAHLERFSDHARRSGLINAKSASLYKGAIRRILLSQPHLAAVPATDADPEAMIKQYAADNPYLATSTISNYRARLIRVLAAYTAYLAERVRQPPPAAPFASVTPGLEIPLPGARTVRFSAPPDLTEQEAAATAALLRLHHPGLAADPTPAGGTWTLVFWPEHAPEEPEAAHLTGPSFRRALADYIRNRCPQLARCDDAAAIDAWYATEVFVTLAIEGHHALRDSATLL